MDVDAPSRRLPDGIVLSAKAKAEVAKARADRAQFDVVQAAAHQHRPALVAALRRAAATLDWTHLYEVLSTLCLAGANYRGEYPPAYSGLRWGPAMNMAYDRKTSLTKGLVETIKTVRSWAPDAADDVFVSRIGVILGFDPKTYTEPIEPTDVGFVDLVCRASLLSGVWLMTWDSDLALCLRPYAKRLAEETGIEQHQLEALLCSDAWRECLSPTQAEILVEQRGRPSDHERDLALDACRNFLQWKHPTASEKNDKNLCMCLERQHTFHPLYGRNHLVVQTAVVLLRPLLDRAVAPDLVTPIVEFAMGSSTPS